MCELVCFTSSGFRRKCENHLPLEGKAWIGWAAFSLPTPRQTPICRTKKSRLPYDSLDSIRRKGDFISDQPDRTVYSDIRNN